jgi:hypothetical protein
MANDSKQSLKGDLFLILVVFIVGAFGVAGVAWLLSEHTDVGIEVILPILLVYGVVTLLVALASLVVILSRFGLTAPGTALGLPEGSVQAVIALVLVLIFAITAVFLLTIDIGPEGISERLATQILTTTGTLAVAVAGFYFGTRAVEAGSKAAESAVRETAAVAAGAAPSVRIVTPPTPTTTLPKRKGEKLAIGVSTVPQDAPVTWLVTGDEGGEVVQLGPENFEYRRGDNPLDDVTIRFQHSRDPSLVAELKVIAPPEAKPPAPDAEE